MTVLRPWPPHHNIYNSQCLQQNLHINTRVRTGSQTNVCAFYQVGPKPTFLMETFLVVLDKEHVYFIADIAKNTLCSSLQLSCLE